VNLVRFSRLASSANREKLINHRFLASAGDDRTLKIWHLPKFTMENAEKCRLTALATVVAHDKGVTALDVAPNDRFLATGIDLFIDFYWKI